VRFYSLSDERRAKLQVIGKSELCAGTVLKGDVEVHLPETAGNYRYGA